MKKQIVLIVTILLATSVVRANEAYRVEIVQQLGQMWRFHRIFASTHDHALRVSGRLTSISWFALPRGHIDLAVFSPEGDLISATTTTYRPGLLTRRMQRKGGLRFSTGFDVEIPPEAIIKVAFHKDPIPTEVKPEHARNVAK